MQPLYQNSPVGYRDDSVRILHYKMVSMRNTFQITKQQISERSFASTLNLVTRLFISWRCSCHEDFLYWF